MTHTREEFTALVSARLGSAFDRLVDELGIIDGHESCACGSKRYGGPYKKRDQCMLPVRLDGYTIRDAARASKILCDDMSCFLVGARDVFAAEGMRLQISVSLRPYCATSWSVEDKPMAIWLMSGRLHGDKRVPPPLAKLEAAGASAG